MCRQSNGRPSECVFRCSLEYTGDWSTFVKKHGRVPFVKRVMGDGGQRAADCLANGIGNCLPALGAWSEALEFMERVKVGGLRVKKIKDVSVLFREWKVPFEALVPFKGADAVA